MQKCRVFERTQNGSDRIISVTEWVFCAAGRICRPAVLTIRVSELTLTVIELTLSVIELTLSATELTLSVTEITLSIIKMTVTRPKIPSLRTGNG